MEELAFATPRPASALTLLRDRAGGGVEVFMVLRHGKSTFMPDVYVFPGGSVVDADRVLEHRPGACAAAPMGPTALGNGFRAAAIRECFEEAGVLLARNAGDGEMVGLPNSARLKPYRSALHRREPAMELLVDSERLVLATDILCYWAHWITPETLPTRFDTHFFLAEMPSDQVAAFDGVETSADRWISPDAALAGQRSGDFPLVIATETQLIALRGFDSVAAVLHQFRRGAVRTVRPRIVMDGGAETILLEQDPPA